MRLPALFVSLLPLALAALLAACDAGNPKSCIVLCGAQDECPDGLTCGSDGYCYGAEETPDSCTEPPVDAASVVDTAADPVDAPDRGSLDRWSIGINEPAPPP